MSLLYHLAILMRMNNWAQAEEMLIWQQSNLCAFFVVEKEIKLAKTLKIRLLKIPGVGGQQKRQHSSLIDKPFIF